jgi:1,4-dihydroxy-2-naphthoate octaprenyltransferase
MAIQPSLRPGSLQIWLMAARLPTLPAAIVPVLVGTAIGMHAGTFRPLVFIAALTASTLIQIGTNLANDYFDFRKGADTAERLGPTRVTQAGLLAPNTVLLGTMIVFGLAALIGLYLVTVGGLPILIIGVLAILAGVLYTAGPFPLAYHGLGDLFVFVFFGLVAVMGSAYLQADTVPFAAFIASLPVAMIVTAIIVVNNLRDIDTDRRTRKYTLAVILGRTGTRLEFTLLIALAYLVLPLAWLAGIFSIGVMLAWLTLPLAFQVTRIVWTEQGRPLNRGLIGIGRLHLFFGILLALGLLV